MEPWIADTSTTLRSARIAALACGEVRLSEALEPGGLAPTPDADKPRRALVVDDSAPSRLILQHILEREGWAVSVTDSGEGALGIVEADTGCYDLIMVDLVMEAMDGVETIRQVRALPAGRSSMICPMSSTVTPALEAACRGAGANTEILRKPFSAPKVRVLLQAILAGSGALPAVTAAQSTGDEAESDASHSGTPLEIDVEGALQRSCGDAAMLRQMLHTLGLEGPPRVATAQDMLLRDDLPGVMRQLHNLRGEMLNLGMPGLAARARRLEQALQEQGKIGTHGVQGQASGLDTATRHDAHQQLAGIASELSGTVETVSRLSILQGAEARPTGTPTTRGALTAQAFAALVAAMQRNEADALQKAAPESRWLPSTYSQDTETLFRKYFDSLDFARALGLLNPADSADAGPHEESKQRRILVVDDAPSTVRLLCRILQGLGSLRFALSGEHALQIARAWSPDLILADIQMGAMSGLDLCRALKDSPETAHSPVILLSSDNDVANEVSALTAGASDFIEKPINPARVIGRVNTQLNNLRRMPQRANSPSGNVRNAPIGFITCTLAGRISEMNPQVAHLLQRPILSFNGQQLGELFESGSRSEVQASTQAIAATNQPASIEARMIGGDGGSIPVRMSGWTAPGAGGNVLWIAIEDIRDWRLAERRRQEKNESGMIASLAGGIAHEFNNLLNIVMGNLDMALEGESDPRRRQRLDAASRAAERAADISRRLGDTARRDAAAQRAPVQLRQVLDNIWPLLTNVLPANVRLVRAAGDTSREVLVDTQGMRSALLAVLQNAADAMPQGGTVSIRLGDRQSDTPATPSETSRYAFIEISDNGPGLSPEVARRAFDPFFTTRSPQRVGLGLTTVHGFVTAHGGRVDIRNAPEGGTVVTLCLPYGDGPTPDRRAR